VILSTYEKAKHPDKKLDNYEASKTFKPQQTRLEHVSAEVIGRHTYNFSKMNIIDDTTAKPEMELLINPLGNLGSGEILDYKARAKTENELYCNFATSSLVSPKPVEVPSFLPVNINAGNAPLQGKGLRDTATSPQGDPYSGTPLGMSGKLAESIRDSFGIDASKLSLRESHDVLRMGARATAQGNVIRFAPGEFKPDTHEGLSILGHELSHVREQAAGHVHAPGGSLFSDTGHETLSDRAGVAFASGTLHYAAPVSLVGVGAKYMPVQRQSTGADANMANELLTVIHDSAKTAVDRLTATYSDVKSRQQTGLLFKNQGPDNGGDSGPEYAALLKYWEIMDGGNADERDALNARFTPDEKLKLNIWHVDTSSETLEAKYPHINSTSNLNPIYMRIHDNTVTISVNINTSYSQQNNPQSRQAKYSALVQEGITQHWSGKYWMDGRWVTVTTRIDTDKTRSGQKNLDVTINDTLGRASAGIGTPTTWNRSDPKTITLYSGLAATHPVNSDSEFKAIAAHEFGHTLGVSDAYKVANNGVWNRNAAPITEVNARDLMRDVYTPGVGTTVFVIRMALTAFNTNAFQQLPQGP